MARVKVGENSGPQHDQLLALVAEERHGTVPNLFATLIEAPEIGIAWLRLGTAVRYRSALDDRLREALICLVGHETKCAYELGHHLPLMEQQGVSLDKLIRWRDDPVFSDRDRAALAYAEAVVENVTVTQNVWDDLADKFTSTEIVAITATVAYYCAVARFLNALEVDLE